MLSKLTRQLDVVSKLSLALGRVERATRYEDGTAETDTTHTFMLLWSCLHVIDHFQSIGQPLGLNETLVTRFALMHDVPEIGPGDVDSSRGLTVEERAFKQEQEDAWTEGILRPWLPLSALTIEQYEQQRHPEARFVRVMDKLMPKLVGLATNGEGTFTHQGISGSELRGLLRAQRTKLVAAGTLDGASPLAALYDEVGEALAVILDARETQYPQETQEP